MVIGTWPHYDVQPFAISFLVVQLNLTNQPTLFLIEKLHLPQQWIDEAQAHHALSQRDYETAVDHLLNARCWSLAHDVVVRHIAPKKVTQADYFKLYDMLAILSEHQDEIPGWNGRGVDIGGGAYLQYLSLHRDLREKEDLVSAVNDIYPRIEELGHAVQYWKEGEMEDENTGNAEEYVDYFGFDLDLAFVQAEMSTHIGNWQALRRHSGRRNLAGVAGVSSNICALSIPPDQLAAILERFVNKPIVQSS